MSGSGGTLVCFAVPEEAKPFITACAAHPSVHPVVTGMGRANAERAVRQAITAKPNLVLTCGFAGALNPALELGAILVDSAAPISIQSRLLAQGARIGRFSCAARVLATATEKARAWKETGADAVEMESGWITVLCAAAAVPCATVRVISDTAAEDLPLDFNSFLTADHRIHLPKLLWRLARSPSKAIELIRFQKRLQKLAGSLSACLLQALSPPA